MAAGGAVKVVFIQTHYIETDPMSFKSVVQGLTGKDSSVATWMENERPAVAGRKRSREEPLSGRGGGGGGVGESTLPVLMKETSFKEFERLMLELPSLEELQRLWSA